MASIAVRCHTAGRRSLSVVCVAFAKKEFFNENKLLFYVRNIVITQDELIQRWLRGNVYGSVMAVVVRYNTQFDLHASHSHLFCVLFYVPPNVWQRQQRPRHPGVYTQFQSSFTLCRAPCIQRCGSEIRRVDARCCRHHRVARIKYKRAEFLACTRNDFTTSSKCESKKREKENWTT